MRNMSQKALKIYGRYCHYRPWYVEAAAKEPKDIVILIDISNPMKTALDLAKAAAIVVLETLNPNDRVRF